MAEQKKILIVDDMRTIRALLGAYLEGADYRYLEAESGVDAIQNLVVYQPDLVISDINMPGMSGIEFCNQARDIPGFEELPVILITSDPEAARGIGDLDEKQKNALLTKPLDPDEIRELVKRFLGE
ncbi:MAG: response regulator [Deltaproteobacteria bacterium]|nr:response regulator [Deltaproteobacteria bacterium]